jgi:hypothetical protein
MAISFVGSMAPVGANNGGNVTLTFTGASGLLNAAGAQATLQQGDVVVCAYASSGTADLAMSTSSSGWTELTEIYANGTIDTNLAVYYKVMGASPDTSFVAVGPTGASNGTIAVAMAFRGCDGTPIDAGSLNTTDGTATSVPNPASTTPLTAGAWPVIVGAGVAGAGAAFTNPGDLSTTTNHFRSANHPETNDVAIGIGIKTDWASGAFDPGAWGGGNVNASNSWAAISFAIKPLAAVTHATTGALTGQIGSVAGSASSATVRPSSGALAGQGSTVAGSAARTRAHATSGALAGPGSTVAGSAARSGAAPISHATSGALTGQGASLSGNAARFRTFLTQGALSGAGAILDGSAARADGPVTHATSGELIGSSSLVGIAVLHARNRTRGRDYRTPLSIYQRRR